MFPRPRPSLSMTLKWAGPVRLPRPLPRAKWVWAVAIGGPALLDWWADRGEPDADTLTENIRAWFHTDTAAGKVAFTVALAGGSAWLHSHILKVG